MSCFCSCWDDRGEPFKNGVFVPNHQIGDDSRGSRGYIPWVWSKKFHETYQVGHVLGTGAYAVVEEATELKPPHQSYAVKIIQRNRMKGNDMEHFRNEVLILLDLKGHDTIIQIHELYKTPTHLYVVTEKLEGGELFDRLCQKRCYSEMDARNVFRTIFEAIAYCHSHGIAHRDLKPENLLLVSPTDDAHVKVADFGFAKRVARPNSLTTRCGTPAYMAPEIINYQPYDQRADNWSLGVLVYTLIGGYNPFVAYTDHLTWQNIRQAKYQFHPQYWDGISRDAKSLIKGLLTRDPNQRLMVDQALSHPWMIGRGQDMMGNPINLKKLKEFNIERVRDSNVSSVSYFWLLTRR